MATVCKVEEERLVVEQTTFRGNRDKNENVFAGLHRPQVSIVSGKPNEQQHGFGFFWKQWNEKQNLHFNLFTTFVCMRREDRVDGGQAQGLWKGDLFAGRWGKLRESILGSHCLHD